LHAAVIFEQLRSEEPPFVVANASIREDFRHEALPRRLIAETVLPPITIVRLGVRRSLDAHEDVSTIAVPRIAGAMPTEQPKTGPVGLKRERRIHAGSFLRGRRKR